MASWPPPRAPRAQISRVPYLPGLDGMRAVAVVAVMVYHANSAWLHGGFLGVEVFFVISGYLITLLLIAEHERDGHVSLGKFWLRRARRLLPALFLMLAGLAVYTALFFRRAQASVRGDFAAALTYTSNWFQIWVGAGYTAAEDFAPLRHLWSLAVEEQFYLLWPLVMIVILRRGRESLPRVALWLAGASVVITVLMAVLYVPGDVPVTCEPGANGYREVLGRCINVNDALYLGTFSRAGGLLLGAAFAMLWRPVAIMRGPLRRKGRVLDLVAFAGVVVLGLTMWRIHVVQEGLELGTRYDPWLYRGGFFLVAVATLAVVAAVTHRGAVTGRLFANPLFVWIGTRSYGLYLYHWPIYQIIRKQAGVQLTPAKFLLAMVLTVPITELSYRVVETPIRTGRLREWLHRERRPRTEAALRRRRQVVGVGLAGSFAVGFAGLSIVIAPYQCVGEVQCSIEAGNSAMGPDGTDPSGSAAPPGSSSTSAPSTTNAQSPGGPPAPETTTTTTLPPTTTTTIPVADLPAIAFGESVMLGAAANLTGVTIEVDAAVSRQGKGMVEAIQAKRAEGKIGKVVIIHTGTNGSVSDETLRAMVEALPPESNLVVFLTAHANKGWVADNNARIKALDAQYTQVNVLEWDVIASEHPEYLAGDGIHLNATGAQAYTAAILQAIGRA